MMNFLVQIKVKDGGDDYGWGAIVNFQKKANQKVYIDYYKDI